MSPPREESGIQLGRLMSSVETLVQTMSVIQKSLLEQQAINSRVEQQRVSDKQQMEEVRTLISGPDGSSGLIARLSTLESNLATLTKQLDTLQDSFESTKHIVLKISLIIGASASAGTAGVSKLLGMFAGQ
tara:strand:- start:21901 stop:22293 length:393 start_codon:yes stop_codon:yes gene_type:complete